MTTLHPIEQDPQLLDDRQQKKFRHFYSLGWDCPERQTLVDILDAAVLIREEKHKDYRTRPPVSLPLGQGGWLYPKDGLNFTQEELDEGLQKLERNKQYELNSIDKNKDTYTDEAYVRLKTHKEIDYDRYKKEYNLEKINQKHINWTPRREVSGIVYYSDHQYDMIMERLSKLQNIKGLEVYLMDYKKALDDLNSKRKNPRRTCYLQYTIVPGLPQDKHNRILLNISWDRCINDGEYVNRHKHSLLPTRVLDGWDTRV